MLKNWELLEQGGQSKKKPAVIRDAGFTRLHGSERSLVKMNKEAGKEK